MTSIAVSAGTRGHRGIRAGSWNVSRVDFAPGQRLAWHAHPHACTAVVLDGDVRKRFTRATADADPGTVVSMPPEEPHDDLFGSDGATIVVVESTDGADALSCSRNWQALMIGLRIAGELALADDFSALALEGLALEVRAVAARGSSPPRAEPWLGEVHALLSERCREVPTAAELAAAVGVHPARLARTFRACYGESLGGCARRLRLESAPMSSSSHSRPTQASSIRATSPVRSVTSSGSRRGDTGPRSADTKRRPPRTRRT
jgi:AraC family transcriptional regulator